VVNQELVRINKLFRGRPACGQPRLEGRRDQVKSKGSKLHFMGIVSDAGVHGMLEHLYGMLAQAKADGVAPDKVFIHAFTDGRDTPPASGLGYVKQVDAKCANWHRTHRFCQWAILAMDRDKPMGEGEKAYSVLTGRKITSVAPSAEAAVQRYYDTPLSATQRATSLSPRPWSQGRTRPNAGLHR